MNQANYARAISCFTKDGTVQIVRLCADIASLFKVKGAWMEATLCSGKWRGTRDYSLRWVNGGLFLLNINSCRTKTDTTVKILDALIETRDIYTAVIANGASVFAALKLRETKDNELAIAMGLKPYTLKRVGLTVHSDIRCGWAYLVLDIGGHERLHTETGLNHAIMRNDTDELSSCKPYCTAGAIQNAEVDFIHGGIGFASGRNCYTVGAEGLTIAAV